MLLHPRKMISNQIRDPWDVLSDVGLIKSIRNVERNLPRDDRRAIARGLALDHQHQRGNTIAANEQRHPALTPMNVPQPQCCQYDEGFPDLLPL